MVTDPVCEVVQRVISTMLLFLALVGDSVVVEFAAKRIINTGYVLWLMMDDPQHCYNDDDQDKDNKANKDHTFMQKKYATCCQAGNSLGQA